MHNPVADKECWIVLIEPVGTKHTGDATTDRTRSIDEQLRRPSLFSTERKQTETPTFFISSKVKPSFPSFSADQVSSTTGRWCTDVELNGWGSLKRLTMAWLLCGGRLSGVRKQACG